MLDQVAEHTRALSTYVRPAEDIETKVSGLYSKISHPVLANVKVSVGPSVALQEIYPPQLPDLFLGGQVVVLARYNGQGPSAIKLTGTVGTETREFVYEITFPDKTNDRQGVCRAPVGPAEGRLSAGSDPSKRREEGTGGRNRCPGEEVRHRHALHELLDRAGCARCRSSAGRRVTDPMCDFI